MAPKGGRFYIKRVLLKMGKYIYELPIKLPAYGCTLVYTKEGIVTLAVVKRADQYIATLEEFLEIARSAGFSLKKE